MSKSYELPGKRIMNADKDADTLDKFMYRSLKNVTAAMEKAASELEQEWLSSEGIARVDSITGPISSQIGHTTMLTSQKSVLASHQQQQLHFQLRHAPSFAASSKDLMNILMQRTSFGKALHHQR